MQFISGLYVKFQFVYDITRIMDSQLLLGSTRPNVLYGLGSEKALMSAQE